MDLVKREWLESVMLALSHYMGSYYVLCLQK